MIRDVRGAKGIREKLFYIFGDPGKIAAQKKRAFVNSAEAGLLKAAENASYDAPLMGQPGKK
jgi:hypothetical protein